MAAQDQPHENYIPERSTTWKRFDDLEITTDKTIESTGFAWWAGNASLINLSGNYLELT
jgi:hypothetical protein